ncbi:hypothetical protein PQ455_05955 [Sphingomonas naphthae]|uniref:Uncharacterized protein n=1 Tax=Sphingomonas naphthae TaxID=1813468 RepID=A0ABY7TNG0_9SPHN|nr:hypothetical protein [Sphingomonas naphthae]WCT74767.1 hypothetical protein PQ455_05955 [Sphingomonas naphthae]
MQHDVRLRAAARAVFDACYPSDDWSPIGFEEAEQRGTVHYRQAVEAVLLCRAELAAVDQPRLL